MSAPNTFVVGCAKAGTSAICAYLRDHDDVFVPGLKEPDWFADDLGLAAFRGIHDEDDYLALFEPAHSGHSAVVDGSPSSLLSAVAAQRIAAVAPDARIVMSLRNPVEVIHALHSQTVLAGLQPIRDFDDAVLAASRPAAPGGDPLRVWTRYFDVVRLVEQVQRYLDAFPRDQIHIIRFEELQRSPASVWADLQTFLGLTHRPLQRDIVNPNAEPVLAGLQRLAFHPGSRVRGAARRILVPSVRRTLRRVIYRVNVRERPREPMPARTRQRILDEVADDIEDLGALLDWDVGGWLTP